MVWHVDNDLMLSTAQVLVNNGYVLSIKKTLFFYKHKDDNISGVLSRHDRLVMPVILYGSLLMAEQNLDLSVFV